MASPNPVTKTGKLIKRIRDALPAVFVAALFSAGVASATARAEPTFSAEVDRRQIGEDESVNLILKVENDDGRSRIEGLAYDAPDFEVVNEYSSTFVSSRYDGNTGQFTVVNSQKLTKVLRPLRTGTLPIKNIRVTVAGQKMTAPDITVYVSSAGQATPPPKNYGGGGVGLRGVGKNSRGPSYLVRAEISKDKAYKGEQIVVSYYLYARVRLTNIEITKWPELKGFLREELEMPVVQGRLDHERVVLNGTPYDRALLVRYAAYPLQEGKLRIDPIGVRFLYFPQGGMDDGEDPFFQFFRQMNPSKAESRSEPVNVEALPLPSEGRPASFSGAVGDFSVTATADRTQVKANEAVNLKVLVQGKGNVAAIGEPKVKWPDGVELYDSKGSAKSAKGTGEKVFDIVLIPRTPGTVTLPPIEFSFFDPAKKAYVTQATGAITLDVQPAAPGSVAPSAPKAGASPIPNAGGGSLSDSPRPETLRYLKAPGEAAAYLVIGGEPFWRWLYWLTAAALLILAIWIASDSLRKVRLHRKPRARMDLDTRWEALQEDARGAANKPWAEVLGAYDRVTDAILDSLGSIEGFGLSGEKARAMAREDLRRVLVDERGADSFLWSRLERVLESSEAVKYAGAAGGDAEKSARDGLESRVREARSVLEELAGKRSQSG